MLDIRPARLEDALWIGAHLRVEDEEEVRVASGRHPILVLRDAFDISRECHCAFWNGAEKPCVIFGVSDDPKEPRMGVVWLLATPEVSQCSRSVARAASRWLDRLCGAYPEGLHNFALATNTLHLRWCLRSGFQLTERVQSGEHWFIHIYRPSPSCVTLQPSQSAP